MNHPHHTGIYVHADTDRKFLINQVISGEFFKDHLQVDFSTAAIYSALTLQHFISEELRHDHYDIDTGVKATLSRASSGEQRRALMKYLLSTNLSCILLDDVYESLDMNTRDWMLHTLTDISPDVLLIQVFSRKQDLLPFIDTIYTYTVEGIPAIFDREAFNALKSDVPTGNLDTPVPPPLHAYDDAEKLLVKLTNVSVQYEGRPILKNINWQINAGEFWQLTGPNGSGKTTILSMINGDNPKAYGQEIYLFGTKKGTGESIWQIKEKIGYFSPNMIRDFERHDSIEQMVISGFFDSVGLYIRPTDLQVKLADDWLLLLGMNSFKNQPFRLFPSGQQRMILIARAMVKHPPLLILDEPTSGLDDQSAALFTTLINRIAAETHTAILYVSHRTEEGLQPTHVFRLHPGPGGSTGEIVR